MNKKDLFCLVGFVKVSQHRIKTLESICIELKMPSEIGRETDLRTSQVSRALGDLKSKNLVVCVNEEVRKGRLYKCTPTGLEVMKYL